MKVVLEHVSVTFPPRDKKEQARPAVDDFDFEIPDGKLVGLLGPSGCGKSTTLNMISGLLAPTSGRIYFGDEDVTDLPPQYRGIGLVFQNYALYPHLTVRKNIMFPLENLRGEKRPSRREMEEMVYEAACLVQIEDYMDRKPSELSGGQQQRVAIARALVKRPGVLLLDEPLSNLDARLRLQTREEIRRIQQETGITTVFVTHDQEEAMSITDIIVVMNAGVIQQIGKPQDVYDDPDNLFVAKFLGTPAINLFSGEVRDGKLFLGGKAVCGACGIRSGKVIAGIRPEGFIPDGNGAFSAGLIRTEVMGRDTSVVISHPDAMNDVTRAIIGSDERPEGTSEEVSFTLKPGKVFLFDPESEKRLRPEGKDGCDE